MTTFGVTDSDVTVSAITLSGLNPATTYAVDDVVILSILGDTPSTVTLVGVGNMNMLGSFATGTKGSVWSILCTAAGTSSFSFVYPGSSFQYSLVAITVSGADAEPTLASSTAALTSGLGDAQVMSVSQNAAIMSIPHIVAHVSSSGLPNPTIGLTETNVPATHGVTTTATFAAAAFGVDITGAVGDTWRWTTTKTGGTIFDSEKQIARWDLTFTGICASFTYVDTAASMVAGLSTPMPDYSIGDALVAAFTSSGGGISGWTTIGFSSENFGDIQYRIADGTEGVSLTLPSGANGFPAVVSSWTPNVPMVQTALIGFGPFYGTTTGFTGFETSSVAGTDTLSGDFGVLSRGQLAPTGEISTMMIAVMENSSFPSGYHWNHGTERASGTLGGAWSYSVADGIHDTTSGSTGVGTNPSIHWPVATSSIFVGGLEWVCAGAYPTSTWDTLSSVATLDHDVVIGQEPDAHHAERHDLDSELDHSGGFVYKSGAHPQYITDADIVAADVLGGAQDGQVAVTYDTLNRMTMIWTRIDGIWVSAEANA